MMTIGPTDGACRAARRRRMQSIRALRGDQPSGKRRRSSEGGGDDDDDGGVVLGSSADVAGGADLTQTPPADPLVMGGPPQRARRGVGRRLNVMPKYGFSTVCGQRRDMEDAVAIRPWFCNSGGEGGGGGGGGDVSYWHYFGVYDGHGCSHVAKKCRERLHEMVKEEIAVSEESAGRNSVFSAKWKFVMERSFSRMDKEVLTWNQLVDPEGTVTCRCQLRSPVRNAVGSTAVVAVLTPDSIVIANCGDSRAVLCRSGMPVPLSDDHKPDRADELSRIQAMGGRVLFWDGARVFGVLSMSRAIGDVYLKPFVSCEPEVTITARTMEDEFLILASDGLWDVVSNEVACGVVRACLLAPPPPPCKEYNDFEDTACNDAAMLLTKLALARSSEDNVSVVVVDLRKKKMVLAGAG